MTHTTSRFSHGGTTPQDGLLHLSEAYIAELDEVVRFLQRHPPPGEGQMGPSSEPISHPSWRDPT